MRSDARRGVGDKMPMACGGCRFHTEKCYSHRQFGILSGIQTLKKETIMREMFSGSMITTAIAGAAAGVISLSVVGTQAQGPAASGTAAALKTPWGEPDLRGIWTDETDTPLQRSPKYANQEFFTEAQRAELDKERAALLGRDKRGGTRNRARRRWRL